MKLGPIQLAWIKSLKENPQLQGYGCLGKISEGKYCCLGEGKRTLNRFLNIQDEVKGDRLMDRGNPENKSKGQTGTLSEYTAAQLGLYSGTGKFNYPVTPKGSPYRSLMHMNDTGLSWPNIAEFVEKNPTIVFKESK